MHSDPVADMVTRIRNASAARHKSVMVPFSELKQRIADILRTEGFVGTVAVIGEMPRKMLDIELRYDGDRAPLIAGINRESRPSVRRYLKSRAIPRLRNGFGTLILTTSRGLMTDRQARREGVGGEVLCSVW